MSVSKEVSVSRSSSTTTTARQDEKKHNKAAMQQALKVQAQKQHDSELASHAKTTVKSTPREDSHDVKRINTDADTQIAATLSSLERLRPRAETAEKANPFAAGDRIALDKARNEISAAHAEYETATARVEDHPSGANLESQRRAHLHLEAAVLEANATGLRITTRQAQAAYAAVSLQPVDLKTALATSPANRTPQQAAAANTLNQRLTENGNAAAEIIASFYQASGRDLVTTQYVLDHPEIALEEMAATALSQATATGLNAAASLDQAAQLRRNAMQEIDRLHHMGAQPMDVAWSDNEMSGRPALYQYTNPTTGKVQILDLTDNPTQASIYPPDNWTADLTTSISRIMPDWVSGDLGEPGLKGALAYYSTHSPFPKGELTVLAEDGTEYHTQISGSGVAKLRDYGAFGSGAATILGGITGIGAFAMAVTGNEPAALVLGQTSATCFAIASGTGFASGLANLAIREQNGTLQTNGETLLDVTNMGFALLSFGPSIKAANQLNQLRQSHSLMQQIKTTEQALANTASPGKAVPSEPSVQSPFQNLSTTAEQWWQQNVAPRAENIQAQGKRAVETAKNTIDDLLESFRNPPTGPAPRALTSTGEALPIYNPTRETLEDQLARHMAASSGDGGKYADLKQSISEALSNPDPDRFQQNANLKLLWTEGVKALKNYDTAINMAKGKLGLLRNELGFAARQTDEFKEITKSLHATSTAKGQLEQLVLDVERKLTRAGISTNRKSVTNSPKQPLKMPPIRPQTPRASPPDDDLLDFFERMNKETAPQPPKTGSNPVTTTLDNTRYPIDVPSLNQQLETELGKLKKIRSKITPQNPVEDLNNYILKNFRKINEFAKQIKNFHETMTQKLTTLQMSRTNELTLQWAVNDAQQGLEKLIAGCNHLSESGIPNRASIENLQDTSKKLLTNIRTINDEISKMQQGASRTELYYIDIFLRKTEELEGAVNSIHTDYVTSLVNTLQKIKELAAQLPPSP